MSNGAGRAADSQPRDTALDDQKRKIDSLASDIETQAERIHSLADRVYGARPQPAKESATRLEPPREAALHRLNASHERAQRALGHLVDGLDRFNDLA